MSDFGDLGVVRKLALPSFLKFCPCTKASLGLRDAVLWTKAVRVSSMSGGHFPIEILAWPQKLLTIQELHVVAEITVFLKGFNLQTKSLRVERIYTQTSLFKRAILSTTLSKIWLSVGPIFTILPITSSFLVRFRPVKYRIEAINVLYELVRRWSAKSYFWSGQRLGQTWSNLPKLLETWS